MRRGREPVPVAILQHFGLRQRIARRANALVVAHPLKIVSALTSRALSKASTGKRRRGRAVSASTGRPGYHPGTLLRIYLYGYLNQVQSSRRLEREAQRNVEVMWLTGRLAPDFKTIADLRRDNGEAIQAVCRQFRVLRCRLPSLTAS